jgi:signal peptidase I
MNEVLLVEESSAQARREVAKPPFSAMRCDLGLTIRWLFSVGNRMRVSGNARVAILSAIIVTLTLAGSEIVFVGELGSPFPVDVVVGSSMMPTLQTGDVVFVKTVPFSDIGVGDVIAFQQPSPGGGCTGITVIHRVVAVIPQGLITQGDDRRSNPAPDEPDQFPPVPSGCVQGKAVFTVPYVGLLLLSIRLTGDYLLIVIVAALAVLLVFRSRKREGGDRPVSTTTHS